MLRYALVMTLVACGGGSKPAPAEPQPAPAPAPARVTEAPPLAPPAAPPLAEKAPEPPPEPAPPPKASLFDRLRDPDGAIEGMPGFSRKRKDDLKYCGAVSVTVKTNKKVAKDDQPLAAVFSLQFPKNLDFDPKNEKKSKESLKKFETFVEDLKKTVGNASKHYEAKLTGDAAASIAAAARLSQIYTHAASLIARAEIPVGIRTGESADAKTDAYCDTLEQTAEPLAVQAEQAIEVCAKKLKDAPAGWYSNLCVMK